MYTQMKKENLDSKTVEQLWIHQLQLEFDDICFMHGVGLDRPVFEISDAKKELGSWCGETGTLRISRHMIVNYSWTVVQQVLKHEMAHQICWGAGDDHNSGHSDAFQRACEILGVLPEFRRHKVLLDDAVLQLEASQGSNSQGERMLLKVEKLLGLGQSSNENEAKLALKKAGELIEKYHLECLASQTEQQYTYIIIDQKRKRIDAYKRYICSMLQKFFFVQVVLSRLYDPITNEVYKTVEIYGTKENTAVAEYCFYFLENRLALLWSAHRQKLGRKQQTRRKSFYIGVVQGFYQTLEKRQPAKQRNEFNEKYGSLQLAEDVRLKKYVGMRCPRVRKQYSRSGRLFTDSYNEGVYEGRKIHFADGVASSKKQSLLLPG